MFRKPKLPDQLIAQRLRTKRRAAAMLVSCMAETGMSFAEIDTRVGRPAGWSEAYLMALINGTTTDLDIVSDLSFAMDVEVAFKASRIIEPEPDTQASAQQRPIEPGPMPQAL